MMKKWYFSLAILFSCVLITEASAYDVDSSYSNLGTEELTDAIFPRTDPRVIGRAYQLLKVLDKELNYFGIPYWCVYGTLLGEERHGGIIPWDDDIDVCIMLGNRSQLLSLQSVFDNYGLELVRYTDWLCKLRPKDTKYPFIDIFYAVPSRLNGSNIVKGYRVFEQMYWHQSELDNLKRVQFGPVKTFIPSSGINRFLTAFYGSDHMTHAVYKSFHNCGDDEIYKIKVKVVNFAPAQYVDDGSIFPLGN